MPAPKDSEKRKLWIKNMIKAKLGSKNHFFGKHLSQEHRDKISNSLSNKKRKPLSQKWKDNLSKAMMGENNPNYHKPMSQEQKYKISEGRIGKYAGENHPMFGKSHSQKTRDKQSKNRIGKCVGENNPMFGRIGKNHPCYVHGRGYDPYPLEFVRIKKFIRLCDGYKCQKCGCPEIENVKKLSIHHIDYNKENCLPENLITLCFKCNGEVNYNRPYWTKYFQKKLAIRNKQSQLCLARL